MLLLFVAGCTIQKPMAHDPVLWSSRELSQAEIFERLEQAVREEGLPIHKANAGDGLIVTDSFDVLTDYCDCGKNLLGADYVGERRGVLRITVKQGDSTTVKFDFTTRLKILANGKFLICDSFGVLEDKLLVQAGLKPKAKTR
ncbi:MAG: hypothetical protein ABIJ61_06485 [bacterium]